VEHIAECNTIYYDKVLRYLRSFDPRPGIRPRWSQAQISRS